MSETRSRRITLWRERSRHPEGQQDTHGCKRRWESSPAGRGWGAYAATTEFRIAETRTERRFSDQHVGDDVRQFAHRVAHGADKLRRARPPKRRRQMHAAISAWMAGDGDFSIQHNMA